MRPTDVTEDTCVEWQDVYADGECLNWIDVFGTPVCTSYEQIVVGQECISYQSEVVGQNCDCVQYDETIDFHCINASGYASNEGPFECVQNGGSWEPMSQNKFAWQSIHASGRMTNVAYATGLARYMSADAKTSHRRL